MPLIPRQNTEDEVAAFASVCETLGGFDERVSAEWADGYMTALAAGWRAVSFEETVSVMFGDAFERAFADPADRERAECALRARHAVLADHLAPEWLMEDPDSLRLVPLMAPWDDESRQEAVDKGWVQPDQLGQLVTGAVWAEGFIEATQEFAVDWQLPATCDEADVFEELLAQVAVLELDEASAEFADHIARTYGEDRPDRDRLIDEACFAIQDLRLWWLDHAPRPETRRVEKKPGRNEPCPCGSGKKYKHCHGA